MPILSTKYLTLGQEQENNTQEPVFYGLVEQRVLVTGANGQLGNELKCRQDKSNNPFRFIFTDAEQLDICDEAQVMDFIANNDIQYIINCAAYTNVEKAEQDQQTAAAVNALGVENLAMAASHFGCKMIHISTDFVFDGQQKHPYTEQDTPNPLSVYGETKLRGEEAVRLYANDWIIIRTSWLYSTFGNNFVKTMRRLMAEKEALSVVDDQIGSPTYAADLAQMIVCILEHSLQNDWQTGIYHFSNTGNTSWFGFARRINLLSGLQACQVNPISSADYGAVAKRPAYSVMDTQKIQKTFGVIIPSWEDALNRCLKAL